MCVCVGLKTPDTAQYEALKLLCSLVMMLLGNGFYGAPALNTDTRFIDQGTNKNSFKGFQQAKKRV